MNPRDSLTVDLFDGFMMPVERAPKPGAFDIGLAFRHVLVEQIKLSPLSRAQIVARMSELLGHEVTKNQLDSWTAESREGWRFPAEYLPAFEAALETNDVLAYLADLRGAKLYVGKDALIAQLGKLERMKDQVRKQEQALKKLLGEQE